MPGNNKKLYFAPTETATAAERNLGPNKHLLGFNDGVCDLEKGIFRHFRPGDRAVKIGYTWDYYNDNSTFDEVYNYLRTVLPENSTKKNMIRTLARCSH